MVIEVTKRLFNPDLDWMVIKVAKRLFNPGLELWRPRGFSTLILTKGNQGVFNLRTGAVATKGLFNLNLDER